MSLDFGVFRLVRADNFFLFFTLTGLRNGTGGELLFIFYLARCQKGYGWGTFFFFLLFQVSKKIRVGIFFNLFLCLGSKMVRAGNFSSSLTDVKKGTGGQLYFILFCLVSKRALHGQVMQVQ